MVNGRWWVVWRFWPTPGRYTPAMSGDDKRQSLLWSDGAGNAATALLLLVAGWILGQLKWDHMLITGVAVAAVLVAFLACRYFYARRHPEPHPLTVAELRAELKDKDLAGRAPNDLAKVQVNILDLIRLFDAPDISGLSMSPYMLGRRWRLGATSERSPRWQALRQTVGLP